MLLAAFLGHVHAYGGGSCYAPPFVFGPVCNSWGAVVGSPNWKVTYSVTVNGNAGTLVCCEGLGYNPGEQWTSIGCGYEDFSGTVPWGNVAAMPSIKCKGAPFGATLSWSH